MMTTFEKCQEIRRRLINRAAEVMIYTSWNTSFAASQIKNFPGDLREHQGTEDFFKIDPSELTESEMIDLGFGKWDEKSTTQLSPLWLFPFLTDEIEAESINGKKGIKKSDMDTDNRFGCLAFGVTPKPINDPIKTPCERCEGSGLNFDEETGMCQPCPDCNGEGLIEIPNPE